MLIFETVLALLIGATLLSLVARKAHIPYPALLALGGAAVALVPGGPSLELEPQLILALFVAPVLLDAAYNITLRDLRTNWRPVVSLVFIAVGLTTIAVAFVARQFFPDQPWADAIALGAIVSPPDAVAVAVLAEVNPPYRIRTILEGESLLNDASSFLIYQLAVGTVAAGTFSFTGALPTLLLVLVGSGLFGWALAWPLGRVLSAIVDAPSSVVIQFASTFAIWLAADELGLSAVIAIVAFALTSSRLLAFDTAGAPASAPQTSETPSLHHDRGTATPPDDLKARPITVSFDPFLPLARAK